MGFSFSSTGLLERSDHDAVEYAVLERRVPFVHVTQRDLPRNEIIEVHPALQIQLGVHGDVALEVGRAEVHALDALLSPDRVEDVQVEADLGFGDSDEVESA